MTSNDGFTLTCQHRPYIYAPNGPDKGPFIMRDTGGREILVEVLDREADLDEVAFFGKAVVIPETHERVYDIVQHQMVLARKLAKPRRVSIEFEFTNEHDVRVIEALAHCPGKVKMTELE